MFPHQFRKDSPFPRQHNSPKRKEGNERVTFRKARGLQMEEIGCKCQTFSISLSSSKRKQTVCQIFGFPDSSVGKESPCNAGDSGSIPGLGRSPGEGKGYPLQYSGLENSMDYIVHGVAKSRTQLSNFHFTFFSFW